MIELNFTKKEFDNEYNEYVGHGREAFIIKYKDDLAFRKYITEEILVKKFAESIYNKQKDIKLTDLPLGVFSIDGICMGQIIKFYDNSINIREYINNSNCEDLNLYLLQLIDIVEELYNNGVAYYDLHAPNILIHNNEVKLIDFSFGLCSVYDEPRAFNQDISSRLVALTNILKREANFNLPDYIYRANSYDDIREYISDKKYTKIRK